MTESRTRGRNRSQSHHQYGEGKALQRVNRPEDHMDLKA